MPRKYKSKAMEALHETMSDLHKASAIDVEAKREFE